MGPQQNKSERKFLDRIDQKNLDCLQPAQLDNILIKQYQITSMQQWQKTFTVY